MKTHRTLNCYNFISNKAKIFSYVLMLLFPLLLKSNHLLHWFSVGMFTFFFLLSICLCIYFPVLLWNVEDY